MYFNYVNYEQRYRVGKAVIAIQQDMHNSNFSSGYPEYLSFACCEDEQERRHVLQSEALRRSSLVQ